MPPKISPFLWYDSQAEEAAEFYVSLFPNSRIVDVHRYPEGAPMPAGSAMMVTFELDGVVFKAINAGPHFQFNEAVSFMIDCADQAEVDHYWDGLLAGGGEPSQCGWLKDRFGLSWQVTPRRLIELNTSKEPGVAERSMAAMMTMTKIDIARLEEAARG